MRKTRLAKPARPAAAPKPSSSPNIPKPAASPAIAVASAKPAAPEKKRKKRTGVKGTGDKAQEVVLEPTESAEFAGQIFKTLTDKFVGNLSFFRIYSGKISAEQPIFNARTGKSSRTGGLLIMQGKQQKPVSEAGGDQLQSLWNSGALACVVAFTLLICAEWVLRRRWGLV